MLDISDDVQRGLLAAFGSDQVRSALASIIEPAVRAAVARAAEDPDLLVGVEEAAARLSMSPGAVRKAVERGKLPVRRIGRRVRFRVGDLLELAATRP